VGEKLVFDVIHGDREPPCVHYVHVQANIFVTRLFGWLELVQLSLLYIFVFYL